MSNPMESSLLKTTEDKKDDEPERKVTMENVNTFGLFLSEARKMLGKNKSEVSKQLGVGLTVISNWEKGDILPDEDRLGLIAEVYGIDLEKLAKVFKISQQARNLEKEARFPRRKTIPNNPDSDVYPSAGNGSYQRGKVRR